MKDIFLRGKPKNADDYEIIKKAFPNKCKDGFVYGYPLYDERTNRWFICVSGVYKLNCIIDNAYATVIEVLRETIGQYTGLTDKNGDKIFEGDVLRISFEDISFSAVVVFENVDGTRNKSFGWQLQTENDYLHISDFVGVDGITCEIEGMEIERRTK